MDKTLKRLRLCASDSTKGQRSRQLNLKVGG